MEDERAPDELRRQFGPKGTGERGLSEIVIAVPQALARAGEQARCPHSRRHDASPAACSQCIGIGPTPAREPPPPDDRHQAFLPRKQSERARQRYRGTRP